MTAGRSFEAEGIRVTPKKIVRRIPCFDDSEYFLSEMSREDTLALSNLAATIGWRKAALGTRDAFVRRYIIDANHSLFLSILPIREGERILDVDAGWRNVSAHCERVS